MNWGRSSSTISGGTINTIVQTSDSGYLISSGFRDSSAVLKISANGNFEWAAYTLNYFSIAELTNGKIVTIGRNGFSILSDKGVLLYDSAEKWTVGISVVADNDSAVTVSFLNDSLLVQKINSNGHVLWSKTLPGTVSQNGDLGSMRYAPGHLIFKRQNDFIVIADSLIFDIDESGTELWRKPHYSAHVYGAGQFYEIRGVFSSGEFYVGSLHGPGLIVHFDSLGSPLDTLGSVAVGNHSTFFAVSADQVCFATTDFGLNSRFEITAAAYGLTNGKVVSLLWQASFAFPDVPIHGQPGYWNSPVDIIRTLDGGYAIFGFYDATIVESFNPPGLSYVIKTDSLGNTDSLVYFPLGSSGVSAPAIPLFESFPNPCFGPVTIRGLEGIREISVSNVLGNRVLNLWNPHSNEFDISSLPAGVYYVRITTASGVVQSVKLAKE